MANRGRRRVSMRSAESLKIKRLLPKFMRFRTSSRAIKGTGYSETSSNEILKDPVQFAAEEGQRSLTPAAEQIPLLPLRFFAAPSFDHALVIVGMRVQCTGRLSLSPRVVRGSVRCVLGYVQLAATFRPIIVVVRWMRRRRLH